MQKIYLRSLFWKFFWFLTEKMHHPPTGCNDNYDGNFDDSDGKKDQKTYKYKVFCENIYQW